MLERRVCAALRTSPATLLGDYKSLSFSAGQLAHLQERQAIEDRQMVLSDQFYSPVYKDWFTARWMDLVAMFPEADPADMEALLYPSIVLRKYQVLDKGRLVKPILEAWEAGAMTYPEMRAELGYTGANVDEVIAEWKENRRALGMPETPAAAATAGPADDGDKDDDESDDEDEDEDDAEG